MNKEGDKKKSISPTRLTIKEVYETYPTLLRRGLTEERLICLVEWDIIGGLLPEEEGQIFIIFKESLDAFLEYHNNYYLERINAVEQNIASIKERRSNAETKSDKKGSDFYES